MLSPLKAPDSIETRLLFSKLQNDGKELKEEMNGGESEKKGEEGIEICEIGENILPLSTKFSGFKTPENEK